MRKVLFFSAAVGALAFIMATASICLHARAQGSTGEVPAAGAAAQRIALAYVSTTHAVLAGVALEEGYYRQEGLEVTARRHSFGRSALEDMLAGNADLATAADIPIMMAIMKGERISIIATIQTSTRDNAIVARKDAGIVTAADLTGKKIARAPGTTSDFFMDAFLCAHGIGDKNVKKIDMKPEMFLDALVSGRVDAVSAFQPFLVQIEKELGDRVLSFYDKNIYTWSFNIVAREEYVRRNPEKVRKLLRALVRAERFVKENPGRAQEIVTRFSGLEAGMVREIWPSINFQVVLDQFLVLALEDESRWAMSSGRITGRKVPNYLDFIHFDGLGSVKPDGVRILR